MLVLFLPKANGVALIGTSANPAYQIVARTPMRFRGS